MRYTVSMRHDYFDHDRLHRKLYWRGLFANAAWAVLAAGAIALSLVADVQLGQATARGISAMQYGPAAQPHAQP